MRLIGRAVLVELFAPEKDRLFPLYDALDAMGRAGEQTLIDIAAEKLGYMPCGHGFYALPQHIAS